METLFMFFFYFLASIALTCSLLFIYGIHELGKPVNFIISVGVTMILFTIFQFFDLFTLIKIWLSCVGYRKCNP
jgi:hypothetical protein